MVAVVVVQLNDSGGNVELEFKDVFTKCLAMTNQANSTIVIPRTVSRQIFQDSIEYEDAGQHYSFNEFIPSLDCGVPKESILSAFPFNIFICDLC